MFVVFVKSCKIREFQIREVHHVLHFVATRCTPICSGIFLHQRNVFTDVHQRSASVVTKIARKQ